MTGQQLHTEVLPTTVFKSVHSSNGTALLTSPPISCASCASESEYVNSTAWVNLALTMVIPLTCSRSSAEAAVGLACLLMSATQVLPSTWPSLA